MFGSKVSLSSKGVMYLFTSSKKLTYFSDNIGRVSSLSSSLRILQPGPSSQVKITKTDFGFVVIDTSSQLSNKGILLELNPVDIQADGSIYLGNSKYAFDEGTKSPI